MIAMKGMDRLWTILAAIMLPAILIGAVYVAVVADSTPESRQEFREACIDPTGNC